MRTIDKGHEPECLAQARRDATRGGREITSGDWDLPEGCKEYVRKHLVRSQHGLCVYCGARISAVGASNAHRGGTRIEHWSDRATQPHKTLAWDNLFASCSGAEFEHDKTKWHCDKAKGAKPTNILPSSPALEQRFRYLKSSGKIEPCDPGDAEALQDIEILVLNQPRIQKNRLEVINRIRKVLDKDSSAQSLRALWKYHSPREGEMLPPYAFVARHYLRPKLRARGLTTR